MMHHSPFERGQAVIGGVLFFLGTALVVVGAIAAPVISGSVSARSLVTSKATYAGSEGLLEDGVYRVITGKALTNPLVMTVGGSTVTVSSQDVGSEKVITASATTDNRVRKTQARLFQGTGVSFFYGVQTDTGGITMVNSATVEGNVFSNGPVTGANSNLVKGSVVSAGPTGLIDGINATSSAYAHTIRNSDVDGNAYYTTISNTSVGGTSYPSSPDQATSTLPITDEEIETWKTEAAAGGTHTSPCPYSITGSVTLGPRKINCDLIISGSAIITLTGPLWVVGNISFANSSVINISSSVGNKSIAIVADNPSDQLGGSRITISNSTDFNGNGGDRSYVLLVSQNRSAQSGGGTKAITISNSANGDLLLYAGHGEIELSNSINLAEVSAWRIRISNSAKVIYKSGLSNLLFSSGPSGGYSISSWQETQ